MLGLRARLRMVLAPATAALRRILPERSVQGRGGRVCAFCVHVCVCRLRTSLNLSKWSILLLLLLLPLFFPFEFGSCRTSLK